MRVFGRALILGFMAVVCVPVGTTAAPIVAGAGVLDGGGDCFELGLVSSTTTACTVFDVDAYSKDPLTVQLSAYEDILLLHFTLLSDSPFSVLTSPFTSAGDGPTIGLFYYPAAGSGNTALEVVTFPDFEKAMGPIISPLDPMAPDPNPRLLAQGDYLLALIHPMNFFGGTPESLLAPFSLDAETMPCLENEAGCVFDVTFDIPEDGNPAPVPEPGTLTLMAGGAIAGLFQRRRHKKTKARSALLSLRKE